MESSAVAGVALRELGHHPRERQALRFEQHDDVVQEISGLGDDLLVTLRDARERELESFLADLLRDAPGALVRSFAV